MPPSFFLKTCSCGRQFDEEMWGKLPHLGNMRCSPKTVEFRNCDCGSTLAVVTRDAVTEHPLPLVAAG